MIHLSRHFSFRMKDLDAKTIKWVPSNRRVPPHLSLPAVKTQFFHKCQEYFRLKASSFGSAVTRGQLSQEHIPYLPVLLILLPSTARGAT